MSPNFLNRKNPFRRCIRAGSRCLAASAYLRIALLGGGIVVTGIFRVFKNLPDVVFSPGFTLFIDIAHLGFMMVYIFSALFFLIIKSGWVVRKSY